MRPGLYVSIVSLAVVACGAAWAGEPLRLAQSSWIPWQPNIGAQAPAPAAAPTLSAPAPFPSAAQPAAPPPPSPFRTEIVRFDHWVATCNDFAEGPKKRICTAQLLVQQSNTNQILLAWVISVNDSKQFVTLLQTPTGIRLGPGVEMHLEKVSKRAIPYETWEPNHCIASIVMDAAMMRDVTASAKVQLIIHAVNGQVLNFDIPIKGFDKAIGQLRGAL